MAGINKRVATTLAVLGPELLLAPPAAIGAIWSYTKYAPDNFKWLSNIVSEHIVAPRLDWFESLGGSLKRARDKYDERRREEEIKLGHPVDPRSTTIATPKERADVIAEVLVKGGVGMAGDFGATLVGQQVLSRRFNMPRLSGWLAPAELAVHLGGIAFTAGPAAVQGENTHYWISKMLNKKFGVDKETADDVGLAIPYIVMPGAVAALGSLALAHAGVMNGRSGHGR